MDLGIISTTELLFMIAPIITIGTVFFLVRYKKNIPEHELPMTAIILLYISALAPLGFLSGLYILLRKRKYAEVSKPKFGKIARFNGGICMIISVSKMLISKIFITYFI